MNYSIHLNAILVDPTRFIDFNLLWNQLVMVTFMTQNKIILHIVEEIAYGMHYYPLEVKFSYEIKKVIIRS